MKGPSFFQRLDRIQRGFERWFSIIGGLTIVALMLLSTADVTMRYVFNKPIDGAYELSEFLLLGMVYFGIAYVQSLKGHVRIDILVSRFGSRGQAVFGIFGDLIGLFMFGMLTWQTGHFALVAWQTGDYSSGLIAFPLWPSKMVIPIGAGMLFLRLLSDLAYDISWLLGREHFDREAVALSH